MNLISVNSDGFPYSVYVNAVRQHCTGTRILAEAVYDSYQVLSLHSKPRRNIVPVPGNSQNLCTIVIEFYLFIQTLHSSNAVESHRIHHNINLHMVWTLDYSEILSPCP
ncbi:hypothetical protein ONE63_009600 [Megalurothrips usitatus]|uniref:Uncharacterized protein n=1 Tax=Megalurothrips usitatus TaxID=439358 RepID=A0AAV7XP85_9NEOP|nr:hypothetical protein ONE63_009600 [Megalurothrips usitatus]